MKAILNVERLEQRETPAIHVQIITVIGIPASNWHREIFITDDHFDGIDLNIPIRGPGRLTNIHIRL